MNLLIPMSKIYKINSSITTYHRWSTILLENIFRVLTDEARALDKE